MIVRHIGEGRICDGRDCRLEIWLRQIEFVGKVVAVHAQRDFDVAKLLVDGGRGRELRGLSTGCSMLQCVAVCCRALQCVEVCCDVLQCVEVCEYCGVAC